MQNDTPTTQTPKSKKPAMPKILASNKKAIIILAVAVLALAGSFLAGRQSALPGNGGTRFSTNDKAPKSLRSNLVALSIEHSNLTNSALAAQLDDARDADALKSAAYTNGEDISAAIAGIYGADAQTKFNELWKTKLDRLFDYANALKNNDEAAKQTAKNAVESETPEAIANYLGEVNPNLKDKAVKTLLADHAGLLIVAADAHKAGDYKEELNRLQEANRGLESFVNVVVDAVAKQHPDSFKE